MDNLEKGSWIINTIKHTTGVRTDTVTRYKNVSK